MEDIIYEGKKVVTRKIWGPGDEYQVIGETQVFNCKDGEELCVRITRNSQNSEEADELSHNT